MYQGGFVDEHDNTSLFDNEFSEYTENEEIVADLSERGNKANSDNGSIEETKKDSEEEKVNYRGRGAKKEDEETIPDKYWKEKGVNITPDMFHIESCLGIGAFGKVYLVTKKDSGKKYAMKVLSKSEIIGNNITRYALTEKNVMSKISHPFIVGLNYAFQTKELLYLILDYWPGGNMGELLDRLNNLPEDVAKIYAWEIILALEELHKHNIIYRDLKPDNVVIDEEGHLRLTDFGLSKEGIDDEFGTKSFWGSTAYLAPEVILRIGHGKPVDWYLLGVLIYEMLSGIPPFYSKDKKKMMRKIVRSQLIVPAFISIEARNILETLLTKDPK